MDTIDTFTIFACSIIFSVCLISWRYIDKTNSSNFSARKKWISQLPSVVSTLGVLGTFIGITKGLMSFDTTNLDTSIPLLLDGLKTAFFTSLLGMFGSLILNRIVSRKFDTDVNESEEIKAAKMIVEVLKNHQNSLPTILKNSNQDLVKVLSENDIIKRIQIDVEQLKDDLEEIKGKSDQAMSILHSIKESTSDTLEELPRLRAVAVTATASIATIDNNIEEMNDKIETIEKCVLDINENLDMVNLNNREEF